MKVIKYKRGQVWWVSDDKNYNDSVQAGNRPVIIISNDANNLFSNNVTVIPCTSKEKKDIPTHLTFSLKEQSTALAEQIKTIPKQKLTNYIGTCDDELMTRIEDIIKIALGLVPSAFEQTSKQSNIEIEELDNDIQGEYSQEPTTTTLVLDDKKRGRKPKYSREDMQRFVNDYYNHDVAYMVNKYHAVSEKAVTNKVYRFNKILMGEK